MDFLSTLKGSMLENFLPAGWDLQRIDKCCSNPAESITERQDYWNKDFEVVGCDNIYDFNMMLGHEIAIEIKRARDEGKKLILILPVGPMGMYK